MKTCKFRSVIIFRNIIIWFRRKRIPFILEFQKAPAMIRNEYTFSVLSGELWKNRRRDRARRIVDASHLFFYERHVRNVNGLLEQRKRVDEGRRRERVCGIEPSQRGV